ncbi:MAG: hypothetical protein J5J00_11920 [Deltaproteobacteria bacterium]|nr:hypothetical protein [Deltaproteobacteria bacterium]
MKVRDVVVYGASVFSAAALLPWTVSNTIQDSGAITANERFPESDTEIEVARIAAYLESTRDILDSSVQFFKQRREFILTMEQTRHEFLRYDLATVEHNSQLIRLSLNQAEQLFELNSEKLEACADQLAGIEAQRQKLEALEKKLTETLAKEQKKNRARSASIESLEASLDEIKSELLPEAKREHAQIRQELLETYAEMHSVSTSDRNYTAKDMDHKKLDKLVEEIQSGKLSLDEFREGIRSTFRLGVKTVTKPEKRPSREPTDPGRHR